LSFLHFFCFLLFFVLFFCFPSLHLWPLIRVVSLREATLDNVANATLDYCADAMDELEKATNSVLDHKASLYADTAWRLVEPRVLQALDQWETYVMRLVPAPARLDHGKQVRASRESLTRRDHIDAQIQNSLKRLNSLRNTREALEATCQHRQTEDQVLSKALAHAEELNQLCKTAIPLTEAWDRALELQSLLQRVLEMNDQNELTPSNKKIKL
jgi:hypothetical protein